MTADTDNNIPDDQSNIHIVDHIVIRDRATGEVLLNRRGVTVERKISEEDWDADQDYSAR